jgi:hypothetical protein
LKDRVPAKPRRSTGTRSGEPFEDLKIDQALPVTAFIA